MRRGELAVRAETRLGLLHRALKRTPETGRALAGAMLRRLRPSPAIATVSVPVPAPVRPYREHESLLPIRCVTPPDGLYMHTFFDISPLSPCGRYLALTRLPFAWRPPRPGDLAEVCVLDLEEGRLRTLYRSAGWALQLGAHVQWHPTDSDRLFCNDLVEGRGVGVEIDRASGHSRLLGGPVYSLDPAGRFALAPALDLINATQEGYGVPERLLRPRRLPRGAAAGEGIWRTDLESGRCELFLSIAEILHAHPEAGELARGYNYLFHTKIDPSGRRLFQIVRSFGLRDRPRALRATIMGFDLAGGEGGLALHHRDWDRGGHHPSWLPDGTGILMNLVPRGSEAMGIVTFPPRDGTPVELQPGLRGSGHPSLHPNGRWLVTDAYQNEGFSLPGDEVPIRLVDLATARERPLTSVHCGPPNLRARRIDPHPAWSRDGRRLVLNAAIDGRRQILIADTAALRPARKERASARSTQVA